MLTRTAQRNIYNPAESPIFPSDDEGYIGEALCTNKLPCCSSKITTLTYKKTENVTQAVFKSLSYIYQNYFTRLIIDGGKDSCICGCGTIIKEGKFLFSFSRSARKVYIFKELFLDTKSIVNRYIINDILPYVTQLVTVTLYVDNSFIRPTRLSMSIAKPELKNEIKNILLVNTKQLLDICNYGGSDLPF